MTKSDMRIEAEHLVSGLPDGISLLDEIDTRFNVPKSERRKVKVKVKKKGGSVKTQPCGHPVSVTVSSDEGTCYCSACEDPEEYYFEVWYEAQKERFRTGQFSCEEEALSAFLEGVEYGKKRVLWGADDLEGIDE